MKPRHILLAVLAAFIWGANFPIIKAGLDELPPLLFTGLRFFVAAVPAVFFLGRGGVPWRLIVSVGLTIGLGLFALLFLGMRMGMPPGLSSLMMQVQALFTVVLAAVVLGDRPRPVQIGGMALALAGMVLVGADTAARAGTGTFTGFVLVLAAAACWGVGNIAIRMQAEPGRKTDMLRLMVWMSLVPPLPMFLLSALFETGQIQAVTSMSPVAVGAVVYNGLFANVLAFAIWGRLMERYPPSVAAPYSLLVPVFGMSLSALLLGEAFSSLKLAGCALMFGGVLLNAMARRVDVSASVACGSGSALGGASRP